MWCFWLPVRCRAVPNWHPGSRLERLVCFSLFFVYLLQVSHSWPIVLACVLCVFWGYHERMVRRSGLVSAQGVRVQVPITLMCLAAGHRACSLVAGSLARLLFSSVLLITMVHPCSCSLEVL